MKKISVTITALFIFFSQISSADVLIKGRLLDENQAPITQAKVELAGTSTDKQGFVAKFGLFFYPFKLSVELFY